MPEYIHLVIRVSDAIYGVPGAMLRHNSVAFWHEGVWLGKPDRGLAPGWMNALNRQIDAGFKTYLFIIDPDHNSRIVYRGALQAVTSKSPPDKELIPRFYRESRILSRMKTWLKVDELVAFRLDEFPGLAEANKEYEDLELEAHERGVKRMVGHFLIDQRV